MTAIPEPPRVVRTKGEPYVWICSMGLSIGLVMVVGLLALILQQGVPVFWPGDIAVLTMKDGTKIGGEIVKRQKSQTQAATTEWQIFTGNRDAYGYSYKYVNAADITKVEHPPEMMVIERLEYGDAIGYPVQDGAEFKYKLITGEERSMPKEKIVGIIRPNALGLFGKAGVFAHNVWTFLSESPREANTEGGIFPAIFGTFVMTLLMSIAVVPFGIVAAIYLREYARQGFWVRAVRIAVNNLAGVPSIVFGVFGLGFFVYLFGGAIDEAFYKQTLPTPTFGTGGILWASLTLALMTVPVIIVATEEALAAVPRGAREASLACGASKWQTIQRVVLPASTSGILTGLILAMARGAGEVAPLMLVGVVKLAPTLPLDGSFPFFHLDRKFMHLGFHIYDLGFQSPDSEAAKPMVFATTLFLILLVVVLNLTAILIRERLRRKYATGAF